MVSEHTVKSFDEELNLLDSKIAEMGGLVEAQVAEAIKALVTRDGDLATRVMVQDKRIDELELQVNVLTVRMLALRQPMAHDLRAAIAALKISNDLERIGDYAVNLSKRILVLTQAAPMVSVPTIARMGRLVQGMIKNVLDSYVSRDADKAVDVRNQDRDVDQLHTSLFRELLTYMMESPQNITPCTHLLFVAKNIERMGDHATNIAENVVFMIRGEAPTERRPTGDDSSVTLVKPENGRPGPVGGPAGGAKA
jgi:phosphate transport system protein